MTTIAQYNFLNHDNVIIISILFSISHLQKIWGGTQMKSLFHIQLYIHECRVWQYVPRRFCIKKNKIKSLWKLKPRPLSERRYCLNFLIYIYIAITTKIKIFYHKAHAHNLLVHDFKCY